ncbi:MULTISPECIES: 4-alpha-glucanotransferase [unclassified Thiobacillus]|uniref:4-alpha-glucanotransferase n=1 Tax=unclassified Thiobacillus TaxID=2646513 RepID=UPI0008694D94|nr:MULTISPECIES: 4-alpha-glucanotransferase [unclassified Thiobacillus]MBN8778290.1 4-alpha-glucanotransferase [Thiobacillus sp.]ODV02220.1 MAG: 4-alpha-glucanotransferase [Thiobacillus sp. SCN 63-57]
MNFNTRRAGILLHPTSLPSCALEDVERWLDFLQAAGITVWQMLPLGIPLSGLSPYQCASAFAVNPALFPGARADMRGFSSWRKKQYHWLDDYARFMVIKQEQGGAPWTDWPRELRDRDAQTLSAFDVSHADALKAVMAEQYRSAVRGQTIRAAAAERGIRMFGDMPIFVAHDSADVWAQRHLFLLDETGHPTVVTGVPPDYFSETGQRWGNPHYNWDVMQADDFAWWRARLRAHFEWFDLVRIDHFRGLCAAWTIPASEPTAIHGEWRATPGAALLRAISAEMQDLPLVAEDLGIITPDVTALRHQFGLPGMSVLQFAFDAHADNPHKPENVHPDTVYYTGTHDNDTTLGWWRTLPDHVRPEVMQRLGISDPDAVLDAMMATVLESRAALAMLPLQDVLHLGSEARMNTPGTDSGNWAWRFEWDALASDLAPRLRQQLQKANRCETLPTP